MQPSIYNGFYRRNGCPLPPLYPSLQRGLVASYAPLLGRQGSTLFDWSGYGRHGTLTNMDAGTDWVPASVRGASGYALETDGSNDYVNCSFAVASSKNYSYVAYVRTTQTGNDRWIVSEGSTSSTAPIVGLINQNGVARHLHRDDLFSGGTSPGEAVGTSNIADGAWHLIVATANKSIYDIWVDGKQEDTQALPTGSTTLNTATIGALRRLIIGQHAQASIALVAVYDRPITQAEQLQIYADPFAIYRYQVPTYETAVAASGFNAAWARRRTQIIGGGCL